MKKVIYAFCALFLLAGFFGLCAIAGGDLPLWETLGLIAVLFVFELAVASVANRMMEKEARQ